MKQSSPPCPRPMRHLSPTALVACFLVTTWIGLMPTVAQAQALEDRFCNITCDGDGDAALCTVRLVGGLEGTAQRRDITPQPGDVGVDLDRLEVAGFPFDPLRPIGSLEARFSDPGPGACLAGFDLMRGDIAMPDPFSQEPLASADIELTSRPMASIGLELGSQLIGADADWCAPGYDCLCQGDLCLDVPIPQPDRHYFFFNVEAGLGIRTGAVNLVFPAGVTAKFVLDPLDPFFYLEGSAFGVLTPPIPGGGFGFSHNVDIPFVPIITRGLEDDLIPFLGDYAAKASFDLAKFGDPELPLFLVRADATAVVSLDPDQDGDHPFYTPAEFAESPDLAIGANGRFNLRFNPFGKRDPGKKKAKANAKPKKDPKPGKCKKKKKKKNGEESTAVSPGCQLLSFRADIGEASGYTIGNEEDVEVWVSGRLGLDGGELLPPWMPFPVTGAAETTITTRLGSFGDNFVEVTGDLTLSTVNMIGKNRGLATEIVAGSGLLRVDDQGFTVVGSTPTQLFPDFPHSGVAEVEMRVTGQGDASVTLRSDFTVEGYALPGGELTLDADGLSLEGTMRIDSTDFDAVARVKGTKSTLTATAITPIHYSREDTTEKLRLLRELAENEELVDDARDALDAAQFVLEPLREDLESKTASLIAAENDVLTLNDTIDGFSSTIASLISQRAAQNNRNCNADYSGCSSCGSCTSRCNCGTLDFACHADCGVCGTALGICLAGRETCRAANVITCNADKGARITALTAEIVFNEGERAAVIIARDVALGVLGPIRAAYELAVGTTATAQASVDAAEDGLEAALAGAAHIQTLIDNLPTVETDIDTEMFIEITTTPKGSKRKTGVHAVIDGRRVSKGRVDLDSTPKVVCLELPIRRAGEICSPL